MLIKPGLLFEQLECYFKMETAQTKKTKTPEDVFSGFGNTDHLFFPICWHFIEIHGPKCWTISLKLGKDKSYFCASSGKLTLRSWFLDALAICGLYTLKDAGLLMHLHTVCGPLDYHVYFPCGPSLLMLHWMMPRCVKCYPLEGKTFFAFFW